MTREGTPAKILDAVQTVIVQHGLQGLSLRLVAEEADVSLGLLSYHFKDKDSLLIATYQRLAELSRALIREAVSQYDDPQEHVDGFLESLVAPEVLDSTLPQLLVSAWTTALTNPSVSQLLTTQRNRGIGDLENLLAAARPDLSPSEVRTLAADVLLAAEGLWFNWAQFADRAAIDRGLQRVQALALK